MLPSSSAAAARYQRRRPDTSPRKKVIETLTRRSRLTNLGVLLISGLCTISLLLNLRYWTFYTTPGHAGLHPALLPIATVNRSSSRQSLNHLILVPCHSVWRGRSSWLKEEDWVLESYQKGPGRVHAFYEHIVRRCMSLSSIVGIVR